MRSTLISVMTVTALLTVGCQSPSPSSSAASEGKVKAEAAAPAAAPDKTVEQASTHVERALRMAKHPFKRTKVNVTDAQLERIVASSYEAFDTIDEPVVRVFVFHYDAAELVKPAKIARWINESGLIHNGQTSANRLRVIVAGTPEAGPVEEKTGQVMNDFMDAFMVMR
ncbi:MAG: hypothetical protein ACPGU1_01930 [Myxococcota bacterium]